MDDSLSRQLQKAGISCRALVSWCLCAKDGTRDRCEDCWLDGPEACDAQVVEALVERLLLAVRQTDSALNQRDYWHGVVDRLTAAIMDDTEPEEGA